MKVNKQREIDENKFNLIILNIKILNKIKSKLV